MHSQHKSAGLLQGADDIRGLAEPDRRQRWRQPVCNKVRAARAAVCFDANAGWELLQVALHVAECSAIACSGAAALK